MPSILNFIDSPRGPLYLVGICLAIIIALYFYNNPLRHNRQFMVRRFVNWFPLGMTYAFLCMGRYNVIVSKDALGALMTKQDLGIIFGVGTWVYALSFLVNGPLIDKKLGGKRGIIVAALGACFCNVAMGVLTYLIVVKHLNVHLAASFSVLYAANMYFQSYGAMSIIKVKAYWFHVRERGIFGAIFGTLISFGVYFAFDWGASIVSMTKANPASTGGWLQALLRNLFVPANSTIDATWAVFFIPAAILVVWIILDIWLIRDTPEEAGFPHLDTCDASSGEMHIEFSTLDLLRKIFASRLMLLIAVVELTSGVFRYSMTEWYRTFAKETAPEAASFFLNHWGLLLCLFGVVGGFAGGIISDKFFQSRRGPPAALLCGLVLILTCIMAAVLFTAPIAVGWSAVFIAMASIGITSLMSGTAATDFGGRKATATCSGIVDGFAYLGSGLQSLCIGFLVPETAAGASPLVPLFGFSRSWQWWPLFIVPFAIVGLVVSIKIWKELPAATKRYIAETEDAKAPEMANW